MSVFAFESVRSAIDERLSDLKKQAIRITLAQLATTCGMQASYVTNVLKNRAQFNSDQLYRVAETLKFRPEEIDFLLMLLEYERTSYGPRKTRLEARLKEVRVMQLNAQTYITTPVNELQPQDLERYYLDPLVQLIHVYLGSVDGKTSSQELATRFGISRSHASEVLTFLKESGFIEILSDSIRVIKRGRHLERGSALRKPHHALMRIKSIEQMQRLPPDSAYSFSATIATAPEIGLQIRAGFLKYLKKVEKLVRENETGPLLQMNFDLFPWDIER